MAKPAELANPLMLAEAPVNRIEPVGKKPERPDSQLSPDAIAETYLATHRQHRSTWSFGVELRPWVETF